MDVSQKIEMIVEVNKQALAKSLVEAFKAGATEAQKSLSGVLGGASGSTRVAFQQIGRARAAGTDSAGNPIGNQGAGPTGETAKQKALAQMGEAIGAGRIPGINRYTKYAANLYRMGGGNLFTKQDIAQGQDYLKDREARLQSMIRLQEEYNQKFEKAITNEEKAIAQVNRVNNMRAIAGQRIKNDQYKENLDTLMDKNKKGFLGQMMNTFGVASVFYGGARLANTAGNLMPMMAQSDAAKSAYGYQLGQAGRQGNIGYLFANSLGHARGEEAARLGYGMHIASSALGSAGEWAVAGGLIGSFSPLGPGLGTALGAIGGGIYGGVMGAFGANQAALEKRGAIFSAIQEQHAPLIDSLQQTQGFQANMANARRATGMSAGALRGIRNGGGYLDAEAMQLRAQIGRGYDTRFGGAGDFMRYSANGMDMGSMLGTASSLRNTGRGNGGRDLNGLLAGGLSLGLQGMDAPAYAAQIAGMRYETSGGFGATGSTVGESVFKSFLSSRMSGKKNSAGDIQSAAAMMQFGQSMIGAGGGMNAIAAFAGINAFSGGGLNADQMAIAQREGLGMSSRTFHGIFGKNANQGDFAKQMFRSQLDNLPLPQTVRDNLMRAGYDMKKLSAQDQETIAQSLANRQGVNTDAARTFLGAVNMDETHAMSAKEASKALAGMKAAIDPSRGNALAVEAQVKQQRKVLEPAAAGLLKEAQKELLKVFKESFGDPELKKAIADSTMNVINLSGAFKTALDNINKMLLKYPKDKIVENEADKVDWTGAEKRTRGHDF